MRSVLTLRIPSKACAHVRWFRFIGSFAANLRYLYRVNVWPGKYGFLAGPFAMWILWMPCIADLLYPFAYKFIVHAAYDIAQK